MTLVSRRKAPSSAAGPDAGHEGAVPSSPAARTAGVCLIALWAAVLVAVEVCKPGNSSQQIQVAGLKRSASMWKTWATAVGQYRTGTSGRRTSVQCFVASTPQELASGSNSVRHKFTL